MKRLDMTIGELVAIIYDEFFNTYGDEEVATMGTAILIDRLLQGISV